MSQQAEDSWRRTALSQWCGMRIRGMVEGIELKAPRNSCRFSSYNQRCQCAAPMGCLGQHILQLQTSKTKQCQGC